MPQGTKIATCCYCGTRAALVLRGRERHELACSSCGAPLHDMKLMPMENIDPAPHRPRTSPGKKTGCKKTGIKKTGIKKTGSNKTGSNKTGARPAKRRAATPNPLWEKQRAQSTGKRKKPKKSKSRLGHFLSEAFDEAFDVIEDIFD